MKSGTVRGVARSRVSLLALMAVTAIGIAGCSGSSGKSGAPGPTGPTGPGGGPGPTGPATPPSIEAGGPVDIGNGSALTAEQIKAIGVLVATIDSASIPVGTPVPVIEFTLKTSHGGAATGLAPSALLVTVAKLVPPVAPTLVPEKWQSYINRTQAKTTGPATPLTPSGATQANSETGVAYTAALGYGLQDLGDGKYRYTYKVNLSTVTTPIVVPFEPSLTHRVGLEVRLSAANGAEALGPDNPTKDLVPDGSAGNGNKRVASTVACDTCHERLDLHGGPRHTVEYCVTCHNPGSVDPDSGNSVDMAYMAHSIHAGELRGPTSPARSAIANTTPVPYVIYGFALPPSVPPPTSFGDVTYPQDLLYCNKCHTASAATPDGDAWMVNSSASACGGCHIKGLNTTAYSATTGYTYTYTHSTFAYTAPDGDCVGCHTADGAAGSTADNHLNWVSASNSPGAPLAKALGAQFKYEVMAVTNLGLGNTPSIKFKVTKPDGTPYNIVTDPAFTTSGAALNINVAWDAATDISNAMADGTEPGLRSNSSPRRSGYAVQMNIQQIRTAAATAQPAGPAADGSYTIPFFTAMPVATTNLMVQMDGHPKALPPGKSNWATESVNAAAGMAILYTGTAKARGLVTQAKCENCHNQLSFHGVNRNGNPEACTVCHNSSGGYGPTDEPGGADLGPIAMGAFVHGIHAGANPEIGEVTYPQRLANCEACHVAGTYYAARPTAIAISTASTSTAGSNLFNATDDTWTTATSGTCGACHSNSTAQAHMTQNGGQFNVQGGKTQVPSATTEACTVCHGPGRVVDTVQVHAE